MTDPGTLGNLAWRDHNTPGVPSSGEHRPLKSEIRAFVDAVQNQKAGLVENLAALKALTSRPGVVLVKSGRAAGVWQWVSDSETTPNDTTVVECDDGPEGRYKRIYEGYVNVDWAGAVDDVKVDSSAAFVTALSIGPICGSPEKNYAIKDVVAPNGRSIDLKRAGLVAYTGASFALKIRGYGCSLVNGFISDGNSRTVRSTTTTSSLLSGVDEIPVASVTGFVEGAKIYLKVDSGPAHESRITDIDGLTITIADPLPEAMASGRDVVSCQGVLIVEDVVFGTVDNIVFSNVPLGMDVRSAGDPRGCGKNTFSNIKFDYAQLGGIAVTGDSYDNKFVACQAWGGAWFKGGVPTINACTGFSLDARPAELLQFGANSWTDCSALDFDHGAILMRSEFGFWTSCNLDANRYWGLVIDAGANKNQFVNLWASSNGLDGGGGIKIRGVDTIENLFNGLHGRFNGPSLVGPDIDIAAGCSIFADENMFQENRVITGAGDVFFHPPQSLFEAGSASAPGISFRLDPNTGIYRASADVVGIASGGSAAATFDVNVASFPDGPSDAFPGISFLQDKDNGFRRLGADNWTVIVGGAKGLTFSATAILAGIDNTYNFGGPSNRFKELFSVNGTVNTSDEDDKTGKRSYDAVELGVAIALATKIGFWKWRDAVAQKGEDGARWHSGITAQDVIETFAAGGLNPFAYGCVGFDEIMKTETYPEIESRRKTREVPYPEKVIEIVDGKPVQKIKQRVRLETVGEIRPVVDEAGDPVMVPSAARLPGGKSMKAPKLHFVPEYEDVEVTKERLVPDLDANGQPKLRLNVRPTQVDAWLAAGFHARLSALEGVKH